MSIANGSSQTPSMTEARGILAEGPLDGVATLGYRIQFGELWAGQWAPKCGGVLARTVHKPRQEKVVTIREWNKWHVVVGEQAL